MNTEIVIDIEILLFLFFLTPAMVTLIWPIRMMFSSKPILSAQWLLAGMMVLTSLAIIFFAAHYYHILSHFYIGDVLYTITSLFIFPLFYMYTCELTRHQGATHKDRVLAFGPAFAYGIAFVVLVFLMGSDTYDLYIDRVVMGQDYSFTSNTAYNIMIVFGYFGFDVLIFLQVLCFIGIGSFRLRRYQIHLVEYNPVLRFKAKSVAFIGVLSFISVLLVVYVILNPYPHSVGEMGMLYVVLIAFSVSEYLIGMSGYQLDLSVKQMVSAQSFSQSSNSNTPKV